MKKNIAKTIALLLFGIMLTCMTNGCATASNTAVGNSIASNRVKFDSNVRGATVRAENLSGVTPCSLMLPSHAIWVRVEKEHYLPAEFLLEKSWTWRGGLSLAGDVGACVIPPAGVAALAVDAGTRSFTELPKSVFIELRVDPQNPPPPGNRDFQESSRVTITK